jgi:hypothetical protein
LQNNVLCHSERSEESYIAMYLLRFLPLVEMTKFLFCSFCKRLNIYLFFIVFFYYFSNTQQQYPRIYSCGKKFMIKLLNLSPFAFDLYPVYFFCFFSATISGVVFQRLCIQTHWVGYFFIYFSITVWNSRVFSSISRLLFPVEIKGISLSIINS